MAQALERDLQIPSLEEFPLRLENLVHQQIDTLVGLGFHEDLDMNEQKYRDSFIVPEGLKQPEGYEGRFDLPLVIDRRIPLANIHRRLGIRNPATERIFYDLEKDSVPEQYLVWSHDARRYSWGSIVRIQKGFKPDEVGSSIYEVTALVTHHPELAIDRGIKAAGSRVIVPGEKPNRRNQSAPYIANFLADYRIAISLIDYHVPDWYVSSRGREVVNLGNPQTL